MQTIQDIALELIDESPTNPRKTFADLEELAASIRQVGLLQRPLVRPRPDGRFELVYGARRFRAAKLAGLDVIAVDVFDLDDVTVLEIQIIENSKRVDVHPLEEADAYRTLHEVHRYAVETIAEKTSRSPSHIRERLRLCELEPPARAALAAGEIALKTALVLARVPKALQAAAVKGILKPSWGNGPMSTPNALEHLEREYMLRLEQAPFDTADATLTAAGACATCPKRSGNQPELLGDVRSKDLCLDKACFKGKVDAHWLRRKAAVEDAGGKVVSQKEAKTLFPHGSHLDYRAPYVRLTDHCHDDPKNRTFAQLLKKADVPPVLARTPDGAAVELLPKEGLSKLLRAAGHNFAKERREAAERTAAKSNSPDRAKQLAKERFGQARGRAIMAAVAAAAAKREPSDAFWRAVIHASGHDGFFNEESLLARRGVDTTAKKFDPADAFDKLVARLAGGDLRALLVEGLVSGDWQVQRGEIEKAGAKHCNPGRLFVDLYRIDLGKIDAAVREQLKREDEAKAAEARAGGKKSASAKGAAKHAAVPKRAEHKAVAVRTCRDCGCTDEHGCDGGCSWVEADLCSACAPPPAKRATTAAPTKPRAKGKSAEKREPALTTTAAAADDAIEALATELRAAPDAAALKSAWDAGRARLSLSPTAHDALLAVYDARIDALGAPARAAEATAAAPTTRRGRKVAAPAIVSALEGCTVTLRAPDFDELAKDRAVVDAICWTAAQVEIEWHDVGESAEEPGVHDTTSDPLRAADAERAVETLQHAGVWMRVRRADGSVALDGPRVDGRRRGALAAASEAVSLPSEATVRLRIRRADWLAHRTGLADVKGRAFSGRWLPDGRYRVLDAPPSVELELVQEYLKLHKIGLWETGKEHAAKAALEKHWSVERWSGADGRWEPLDTAADSIEARDALEVSLANGDPGARIRLVRPDGTTETERVVGAAAPHTPTSLSVANSGREVTPVVSTAAAEPVTATTPAADGAVAPVADSARLCHGCGRAMTRETPTVWACAACLRREGDAERASHPPAAAPSRFDELRAALEAAPDRDAVYAIWKDACIPAEAAKQITVQQSRKLSALVDRRVQAFLRAASKPATPKPAAPPALTRAEEIVAELRGASTLSALEKLWNAHVFGIDGVGTRSPDFKRVQTFYYERRAALQPRTEGVVSSEKAAAALEAALQAATTLDAVVQAWSAGTVGVTTTADVIRLTELFNARCAALRPPTPDVDDSPDELVRTARYKHVVVSRAPGAPWVRDHDSVTIADAYRRRIRQLSGQRGAEVRRYVDKVQHDAWVETEQGAAKPAKAARPGKAAPAATVTP